MTMEEAKEKETQYTWTLRLAVDAWGDLTKEQVLEALNRLAWLSIEETVTDGRFWRDAKHYFNGTWETELPGAKLIHCKGVELSVLDWSSSSSVSSSSLNGKGP